jgi:hypothetical protein
MRWITRWYVEQKLESTYIAVDKIVSPYLHLGPTSLGLFGNTIHGPIDPEGVLRNTHPFRAERDNDINGCSICGLGAWYPGSKRSKQFY